MSDNVNKPSHYAFSEIECIDYLRAIVPLRSFIDHCRMSAIAYITRSPHKGSEVEDIDKAINYLQRARNEAEKAIEEAESNCPETPDSSRAKSLAIPEGWRELEPDETPLATDMHEWMGGWFFRKDDATHEYCWFSNRHIRKIETANPSDSLTGKQGYFDDADGVWVDEPNPFDGRKIETDNPEHVECVWVEEAEEKPVFTLDEIEELIDKQIAERERIKNEKEEADANASRKIETANTSETPNSSILDPGPGYRLLSKDPPEQVIRGDEFWQNFNSEWVESENFMHEGGPQSPELYYRRKIEPAAWIPKVGDKVRVNYPRRTFDGKVGVIVDGNAGRYAVRLDSENFTAINLKAEHLELIEAFNSPEAPNSSTWIPKVGDRVRVNCPGRIAHNKAGLIIDVPNSEYAVRIEHEKLTTFNLKAEHLELIEAAS